MRSLVLRALLPVSLLAALTACGGSTPSSTPATSSQAASSAPALSDEARRLVALLPAGTDAGEWAQDRAPQVYGAGNLWEYINGAAETYLGFNFQEMATAPYHHPSGTTATVDVFRMGRPLDAFGIYAQEMNPNADAVPLGTDGYAASNVVNFWSGSHYVKITAQADGPGVGDRLRALAGAVNARLGTPPSPPPELAWFPPAGLVPRSVRFVPHDVLGQSFLAEGLEGEYRDGARTWKLTAMRFSVEDAAKEAFGRYRDFLASNAAARPLAGAGDEAFTGSDAYYGAAVCVRARSMLLVGLGSVSPTTVTTTMRELLVRAH